MIDRKNIDDMARIMALINSPGEAGAAAPLVETATPSPAIAPPAVLPPEVAQMKSILETIYRAQGSAPIIDREFEEAVITEQTETGARIGDYEIVVQHEGRLKTYDIVQEGEVVVVGLSLLEAARGVIRVLNRGGTINHPEAKEILDLEGQYYRLLSDAIVFKHREKTLAESGNYRRAAIMADRYSDVRDRALKVKESVSRSVRRLR